MRSRVLVLAAVLVVIVVGGAVLVLRPAITSDSTVMDGVVIECAAATGVSDDECRGWGDEILAAGPPSFTFDVKDLVRLTIDRPWFGLGTPCEAAYWLVRFDSPVWRATVDCR